MIEINIRNYRHARDGDIGGVEPAAHPDFEHREIRGLTSEINEAAGGEKLKETWPLGKRPIRQQAAHHLPDDGEDVGEIGVGNLPAVEPDSFIRADQVRRSIKPRSVTGGFKNCRQKRRSGSFAVGSGHDGRRVAEVRGPERSQNSLNGRQFEFHAAEFLAESSQLLQTIVVIHRAASELRFPLKLIRLFVASGTPALAAAPCLLDRHCRVNGMPVPRLRDGLYKPRKGSYHPLRRPGDRRTGRCRLSAPCGARSRPTSREPTRTRPFETPGAISDGWSVR